MYETRNETNRRPVTCGEGAGPDGLTFRFRGGESDQGCWGRPKTDEISRTRRSYLRPGRVPSWRQGDTRS